jgi:hypothetical protein
MAAARRSRRLVRRLLRYNFTWTRWPEKQAMETREMSLMQPGVLLARGVCRALVQHGWSVLTEVTLANGRRADIMALLPNGDIVIVEVKSSLEDFRADRKWGEYRDFCDSLYFAISDGFPHERISGECGLIAADAFGAEILRAAPVVRLAPARRKAVTFRFAQMAAQRLQRLLDPGPLP